MTKLARAAQQSQRSISKDDLDLCNEALEAARRTYAPYSSFAVGAAIRTSDGKVFAGANVENAAYGVSICAEMAALTNLSFSGDPKDIEAVAVAGYSLKGNAADDRVVTPCGRCRQLILEFATLAHRDIPIFCCNGDLSRIEIYGIKELLPHAFGPKNLERMP